MLSTFRILAIHFFSFIICFSVYAHKLPSNELPIIILIYSYNNAELVEKNLESVFAQSYSNYRIIYIDDCPQDRTNKIVEDFILKHGCADKLTLIKNTERHGKLKSLYNVVHELFNDNEIVIQLDGCDCFVHSEVLHEINDAYQNPDVWLTWGQFLDNSGKRGGATTLLPQIINKRAFRKYRWVSDNQFTFYAWLFKLIYLEDLLVDQVHGWESKFYPVTIDLALLFPMLEIAQKHIHFMPKPAYIKSRKNDIRHNDLELLMQKEHAAKPVLYKALEKPILNKLTECENACADVVILSFKNYVPLKNLLDSIEKYMINLGPITVFCECSTTQEVAKYKALKRKFKQIKCINLRGHSPRKIYKYIKHLEHEHIFLMHDLMIIDRTIDVTTSINLLEKTGAQGIFCSLSPVLLDDIFIPYQHIIDDIYAWKFSGDFLQELALQNFACVLYRKEDLMDELAHLQGATVDSIESICSNLSSTSYQVGLFYQQPKALSVSA